MANNDYVMNYTETTFTLLGIEGRMFTDYTPRLRKGTDGKNVEMPGAFMTQVFKASRIVHLPGYGLNANGNENRRVAVEVRFDDQYGNGHNTLSITGEVGPSNDPVACGQIVEEIALAFPELIPLLPYHLISSDGPMHYAGNAAYHASDRDYRGLLKGEKRQLRNGKTNLPVWQVVDVATGEAPKLANHGPLGWTDSEEAPTVPVPVLGWGPVWIVGEGKERDFAAARSVAVWPEATDEELSVPRADLEKALQARLPALMARFRELVESCGFRYE